jgi:3-hydroxyacyl-[acyl-carrier-protein] dehydratase
MLRGLFYQSVENKLFDQAVTDLSLEQRIKFIESSSIFSGHFPGNPVVPGVCQVQMVREMMEEALQKRLILEEADTVKFTHMINPFEYPEITISLNSKAVSEEIFQVSAVFRDHDTIFTKFRGKFKPHRQ